MSERFLKAVGSVDAVGTRGELDRLLDDIAFAKAASDARLRQLAAESQPEERLAELAAAQRQLARAAPPAAATGALLGSASGATGAVRARVADALLVYERAAQARRIADSVIELRDCLRGCHDAMDVCDWERAATLASRARAVPAAVAESEFALKTVPSVELPESPQVSLDAACAELAQLFAREFRRAARETQMDRVSFYFRLFPLVGHAEQGLQLYAEFIGQTVAGLARAALQGSSGRGDNARASPGFYAAVLTNLFENVASIVTQHTPIVARHYGAGAMARSVLPHVQAEVDRQAGLLIDAFWDERRVEMLLTTVRSYAYPGLASAFVASRRGGGDDAGVAGAGDDGLEDLQEASARLSEIGTMLNRWSLFQTFMRARDVRTKNCADGESKDGETKDSDQTKEKRDTIETKGEKSTKTTEKVDDETPLEHAIATGSTAERVATLLGPTFAALLLYVFRRAVERAVRLDELPALAAAPPVFSTEAPLASSLVDDVMYVFNQVLLQAVDAGHAPTAAAALASLQRVLESDLIGAVQRKLQAAPPQDAPAPGTGSLGTASSSGAAMSSSTSGAATAAAVAAAGSGETPNTAQFMVYLNDLELLQQYVGEAVQRARRSAASPATETRLDQLQSGVMRLIGELLTDGSQSLAAKRGAPAATRLVTQHFKAVAYSQPEAETRRAGTTSSFVPAWRGVVAPLRRFLHPAVLGRVLDAVARLLATQLEKLVWSLQSRASEAGALLLERDVSQAASAVVESHFGLRRRFARVLQLVGALADETADVDLLSADERLRAAQMRRALLRV